MCCFNMGITHIKYCIDCKNARDFHKQGICKCSCHPIITCLECNGTGQQNSYNCLKCKGSGEVINLLAIKISLFT